MATAGTPPNTKPSKARKATKVFQSWVKAVAMFKIDAMNMDTNISFLRPNTCENALDNTIDTAKKPVVSDKAKALLAGLMPKLLVKAPKNRRLRPPLSVQTS